MNLFEPPSHTELGLKPGVEAMSQDSDVRSLITSRVGADFPHQSPSH